VTEEKKQNYYIGLMSGTSLDGIDAALCEIDAEGCTLVGGLTYPMPSGLRKRIVGMITAGEGSLHEIGMLDREIGMIFARAANALLEKLGVFREEVRAIGSHGQTLWHAPEGTVPMTMQLGDPSTIAALTGITTVADFRRKDIALGGQGAPLVPAFHRFVFGLLDEKSAVVNIGGIANITMLGEKTIGYDTGCGNVLMDSWISRHRSLPYDGDGAWAREGKVDDALLERMLDDPYFALPFPKSTGREYFNPAWLDGYLDGLEIVPADVQATLLELTARTIADEALRHDAARLVLCGGGARNGALVARIAALTPARVETSGEHGVSIDFMEAMAFAWLAYKRLRNEKIALSSVTGAREDTILGGVYE